MVFLILLEMIKHQSRGPCPQSHFQFKMIFRFETLRLGKPEEDNSRQRHYSSILLGLFGGKFPVFKFLKFNFPLGRRMDSTGYKTWQIFSKLFFFSRCGEPAVFKVADQFFVLLGKKIILTLISG